jgi:hypothetical protein
MAKLAEKIIDFMMPVMEKLTPSCEIISQKISRSMDQPISLRDRIEIRIHTFGCILCELYWQQLLTVHQLVGKSVKETDEADPE